MLFPVHIGVGNQMGVVIADCAVDFAQKFLRGKLLDLALQTRQHVGDFFAHRGGRGGLPVRARHHGHGGQRVRHLLQLGGDFAQFGQQHFIARLVQHQGVRQVVDVFAGAGKVDEFAHGMHFGVGGKALFEPVFNRFHVVVGGGFYGFDFGGVAQRKAVDYAVYFGKRGGGKRGDFADFRLGSKSFEPFQFHAHARFH